MAERVAWTPERIMWFRAFVPGHSEREISDEHARVFGFPLTRSQVKNGKSRFGVRSGTVGGRFVKGQASWNKGKTWDEFMGEDAQRRSRATCFKRGNMPHNGHQPVGTERTDRDGYVWVKVAERKTDPRSAHDNWVQKHRLVWERENGPIPEGHSIVFVDHDKTNCDISNLRCVPRSAMAVINRQTGWSDADTLDAAVAYAELKSAIRAKRKEQACTR